MYEGAVVTGTYETMKKRGRGRPAGPKTVRYPALLEPAQKRDLETICEYLEGKPKLAGIVREALAQYIAVKRQDPAIRDALDAANKPASIRVVK